MNPYEAPEAQPARSSDWPLRGYRAQLAASAVCFVLAVTTAIGSGGVLLLVSAIGTIAGAPTWLIGAALVTPAMVAGSLCGWAHSRLGSRGMTISALAVALAVMVPVAVLPDVRLPAILAAAVALACSSGVGWRRGWTEADARSAVIGALADLAWLAIGVASLTLWPAILVRGHGEQSILQMLLACAFAAVLTTVPARNPASVVLALAPMAPINLILVPRVAACHWAGLSLIDRLANERPLVALVAAPALITLPVLIYVAVAEYRGVRAQVEEW